MRCRAASPKPKRLQPHTKSHTSSPGLLFIRWPGPRQPVSPDLTPEKGGFCPAAILC
jgi:hypothetical protein